MPSVSRKFVISDIHGCFKSFEKLVNDKIKLTKEDKLYLLGDYIDRGPSSKQVVDMIIDMIEQGYDVVPLLGNHEQLMTNSSLGQRDLSMWLLNGGEITLESFGIKNTKELEEKYVSFFYKLEYYVEEEGCYLVHAGFNFNSPNIFADHEAMIWIRDYKVEPEKLDNKTLIHGHTPISIDFIEYAVKERSAEINLDNGCVYSHVDGLGNLCCLDLDTYELILQENIEH